MKKSQIVAMIKEAISSMRESKNTKGLLGENAMAELDIIAQESSTFADFLKRVQAELPEIGTITSEIKKFLQKLYMSAMVKEIVVNEMNGDYRKTTTEQFLKMLQEIKQQKLFPNAKWGLKYSMGGGISYMSFSEFVKEVTDQIAEYKSRGADEAITNYYIWNIEVPGVSYSDTSKVVNDGPDSIVTFGQTTGKDATKISTSWESKSSEEFAKAMARGDYGPLD